MAIEDLREIGNVLYRVGANGMLYPVQRMRPDQPAARNAPSNPGLLDVLNGTGIAERAGLANQMLNPLEAIGGSMRASERMLAPDTEGWDRVQALGDMLSGVAGVAAPAAVAGRAGVPAATALVEGLLGGSPAMQTASDTARSAGRAIAKRASQRGPVPTIYSNPVAGLGNDALPVSRGETNASPFGQGWADVYHWSRSPEGFSEFEPDRSTSVMSQLGPHVGTKQAAEARYMGWAGENKTPPPLGFTLPLKADTSKPFLNPATNQPWFEMDLEMFISAVADENGVERRLVAPLMRDRLARAGYTSIPYINDVEDAGNVSSIMLTERPAGADAVVRSRFANFDPQMRSAKDMSAGMAAGVPLGLLSMQPNEEQY